MVNESTLPDGKFEWLSESDWQSIDWLTQSPDQDVGYFAECDLDYPDHLHDTHNDYPLAPERLVVETDMLSSAQVEQQSAYDTKGDCMKFGKLIPNLFPKRNYACHYANLRFYMEHGLVLKKVHSVIRFHQSRWLAPYIAKNSDLRAKAHNDFEKDFYKLMNNAVYGKTCENVLKRQNIQLVTDGKRTKSLINKPHCTGYRIFTEDIAAVALQKLQVVVNKPTYVGLAVLEYAKLHMYRFHYDQALKHWPDGRARLVLTDTDSLLYEIQTEDVYEDIRNNADLYDWFDLSNYPEKHPMRNMSNKMVIGKMKDETGGKIMTEVVGLRAKMYSFKVYDPETGKFKTTTKAKGIQKASMGAITHEDYVDQLHNPHENHVTVRRIGQVLHTVLTFEQQKRALCALDTKRYLLDDHTDTLAHGHCRIRSEQPYEEGTSERGLDECRNVFTDEDGDQHLVVRHDAAKQSPMLQQLLIDENEDGDDAEQEAPNEPAKRQNSTVQNAVPAKRARLQQPTTDQNELAAAKSALLRGRFDDTDFEIAKTLISAAQAGLEYTNEYG